MWSHGEELKFWVSQFEVLSTYLLEGISLPFSRLIECWAKLDTHSKYTSHPYALFQHHCNNNHTACSPSYTPSSSTFPRPVASTRSAPTLSRWQERELPEQSIRQQGRSRWRMWGWRRAWREDSDKVGELGEMTAQQTLQTIRQMQNAKNVMFHSSYLNCSLLLCSMSLGQLLPKNKLILTRRFP